MIPTLQGKSPYLKKYSLPAYMLEVPPLEIVLSAFCFSFSVNRLQ